jgi:hypothetical protein
MPQGEGTDEIAAYERERAGAGGRTGDALTLAYGGVAERLVRDGG